MAYALAMQIQKAIEFQIDENLCIVESSHIGECVTKLDTFIDACADKIMIIPAYYLKH